MATSKRKVPRRTAKTKLTIASAGSLNITEEIRAVVRAELAATGNPVRGRPNEIIDDRTLSGAVVDWVGVERSRNTPAERPAEPISPTSELEIVRGRINAIKVHLINNCGALSVAVERITGRTILPTAAPSAATVGKASGMIANIHTELDELSQFLGLLDEIVGAVGQL